MIFGTNKLCFAIVAYDLGFNLTVTEIDPDHYKDGLNRFQNHVSKYAPASEIPINHRGEMKLF